MNPLLSNLPSMLNPELRNLLKNPSCQGDREFVEFLWQNFEPYADKNFRREIADKFHSRFWEMYLACALLDQGFSLVPKTRENGPDLHLKQGDSFIWLEAVAATGGTGLDSLREPEIKAGEVYVYSDPEHQIILRYCSVLLDKYIKYQGYLKNSIIGSAEPYIVALNGRRVPFSSDDDIPYILKAVVGIGDYVVTFDSFTGDIVHQGYALRAAIKKANDSLVSTRMFLEQQFSPISALLFSRVDLLNRPRQFGTDFVFVHNPLAVNPISRGWLRVGKEYWVENGKVQMQDWNKSKL